MAVFFSQQCDILKLLTLQQLQANQIVNTPLTVTGQELVTAYYKILNKTIFGSDRKDKKKKKIKWEYTILIRI
jgi:hypothetical protein